MTRFANLRAGQPFVFEHGGPVWVKARGGYHPGRGGQLHACAPYQEVIPVNGAGIGLPQWNLIWAPEGKTIGTAYATTARGARRQAPAPYNKFPGEIRVERV